MKRATASIVLLLALAVAPAQAAQTKEAAAAHAAEISSALARLGDPSPKVRVEAVDAIAATPPEAFPSLEGHLLRTPEAGAGPMWLVLEKLKKDDPKLDLKKADRDPELARAVASAGSSAAHRSAALLLSGILAAEREGGVVGARVLVRLAVEHKALFKSQAAGALRRMGDRAVAALIEVRRDNDKDVRSFANKTLDALGKFLPSDAVQVQDPQALAEVLLAFGKVKDPDAIRAIVPYLNADRTPVRDAARTAILQFGDAARPALKETFDQYTGERAGDDWSAEKILAKLVVAYDRVRLAEVFKLLDEGIAHREAGRLEESVASFDALLARAPTFERRAELAPAYLDLARKQEPTDRAKARLLFAKAARLAHGTPLSATIEADLAVLDTQDQLARGVADPSLLHKALTLDPSHARAKQLLATLESETRTKEDRLRRFALAGFVGLVTGIAATLFLGRRPKRASRPVRI
jgi:tetratricopeptide (TPR) repeat protein